MQKKQTGSPHRVQTKYSMGNCPNSSFSPYYRYNSLPVSSQSMAHYLYIVKITWQSKLLGTSMLLQIHVKFHQNQGRLIKNNSIKQQVLCTQREWHQFCGFLGPRLKSLSN